MLRKSERLPSPAVGAEASLEFVAQHMAALTLEHTEGIELCCSLAFRGGQSAADKALADFDVTGYAGSRNEVLPSGRRSASGLSPYIRHGLITLRQAWEHVEGGPSEDVRKFRDELLWQEYCRHWYGRLGTRTQKPTRFESTAAQTIVPAWNRQMACVDSSLDELEEEGWMVNQARMWLASQWSVRSGQPWRAGEDFFFRHLLDGSRAANRLGWQNTTGHNAEKAYGFSRWQVEKRAPGLCADCELVAECPIEQWPQDPTSEKVAEPLAIETVVDVDAIAGPERRKTLAAPASVWLTAESLGTHDPALVDKPDLPAVFVFDHALLNQLKLSSKRLTFLVETLAELGTHRELEVWLGDPVEVMRDRHPAVTFAPTPGFATRSARIDPALVLPYPWLLRPSAGSVASFSKWRRGVN